MHKKRDVRIIVFLILLMSVISGYGRDFKGGVYDHRIISFNQGVSFSGDGDGWGTGNEVSFMQTILPVLYHRESISSWLINGEGGITGYCDQQSGYDVACELGISPFRMKERMLSLTVGGCFSYQYKFMSSGAVYFAGDSYLVDLHYDVRKVVTPGFTIGANYYTQVNQYLWLNVRGAIRSYNAGSIISIISVGIGFDPLKLGAKR